jgi:hypothetical protein
MKTAVQELIDKMEQDPMMYAPILVLIDEMKLIEKEKEQMCSLAYKFIKKECRAISGRVFCYGSPSDVYEEMFNTESK